MKQESREYYKSNELLQIYIIYIFKIYTHKNFIM